MITGLVIGFIVGCFVTMFLVWTFVKEADARYNDGLKRYEEGTQAYKKAVRTLEVYREESTSRSENNRKHWNRVVGMLQHHLPPRAWEEVKDVCNAL
jgi:hypothetical protein